VEQKQNIIFIIKSGISYFVFASLKLFLKVDYKSGINYMFFAALFIFHYKKWNI
jgi:hypothetical protein